MDGEERGYIPMTDYSFPRRIGERSYSIGMLGGETRPSTGYTFLRIQRYCRVLAEALAADREPPYRVDSRRFETLDAIFLRFMRRHPERCPDIYARMFGRVSPGALIRFLTERSTPLEDLRLVLALPKAPFLKIAVPERAAGMQSLLGLYLVAISILALPHVAVASWMDLRQGIWR